MDNEFGALKSLMGGNGLINEGTPSFPSTDKVPFIGCLFSFSDGCMFGCESSCVIMCTTCSNTSSGG